MAVSAAEMVARFKEALSTGLGVVSVTFADGRSTTFNRKQAIDEYQFWQREAAREDGSRQRFIPIDLA
jgi:hypothetical protein